MLESRILPAVRGGAAVLERLIVVAVPIVEAFVDAEALVELSTQSQLFVVTVRASASAASKLSFRNLALGTCGGFLVRPPGPGTGSPARTLFL